MKKTRILQVTGGLGIGGIEKLVVSFYEKINRDKFEMDFLVYGEKIGELEEKVKQLGGKVLRVESPAKNYFKFYKNVCKIMIENGPYDVVHSHVLFNTGFIIRAAAKTKIPMRISHSHDNLSYLKTGLLKSIYIKIMRRWMRKYSTKFYACSSSAGEYLFGRKLFKEKGNVLLNSIDINKFEFDECKRAAIRKEFNIGDEIVIGNIGRLERQKNQEFLLAILQAMNKQNKKIKLILVGDGNLKSDLELKLDAKGLKDQVIMTGSRNDICDLLCAMDMFVLTSIHEGLGIVLIEAQANGLACIAPKDIVPSEAKILDTFKFVNYPNIENLDDWIKSIEENMEVGRTSHVEEKISAAGYDANTFANRLEQLYSNT